mmetsp:Transcript_3778/g.13989  ORF Transcript_3778/g.13989 Transcript_3778/m.13989 type:complete len:207 (-) Transcript_3778:1444-2064(-)
MLSSLVCSDRTKSSIERLSDMVRLVASDASDSAMETSTGSEKAVEKPITSAMKDCGADSTSASVSLSWLMEAYPSMHSFWCRSNERTFCFEPRTIWIASNNAVAEINCSRTAYQRRPLRSSSMLVTAMATAMMAAVMPKNSQLSAMSSATRTLTSVPKSTILTDAPMRTPSFTYHRCFATSIMWYVPCAGTPSSPPSSISNVSPFG